MEYIEYNFASYRILAVKTNRFKNCHIEINFLDDATNINCPLRIFLAEMMAFTTKKYQNKRELLIALEELYNSGYTSNCMRIGHSFITSFSLDFLDPFYVKDKDYLKNCINFLCEAILNPNFTDESVDERSFNIIKERLLNRVTAYKERALDYAIFRSKEFVFDEELLKKPIYGTKEDIKNITCDMIKEDYQKMLKDASVDILIIGDLDMEKVSEYLKESFKKESIVEREYSYFSNSIIKPKQEIIEESNYVQTQLLMYLQFKELTSFEINVVSLLYITILGGANHSDKLAKYLRTENSLCYYRGIKDEIFDKCLVIYTGLQYENVSKAQKLIKKALKEMELGDIKEDYLEKQKEKIVSDLTMNESNEYYLLNNYYFHKLFNIPLVKDLKKEIMKVTIQDIKGFAKKLSLTTTYILKEQVKNEGN